MDVEVVAMDVVAVEVVAVEIVVAVAASVAVAVASVVAGPSSAVGPSVEPSVVKFDIVVAVEIVDNFQGQIFQVIQRLLVGFVVLGIVVTLEMQIDYP